MSMLFAETLKSLRMEKEMSQRDLAERIYVTRSAIAKWENGESIPDIMRCSQLAEIFDIDMDNVASMFIQRDINKAMNAKRKFIFGKCRIKHNRIVIPEDAQRVFGLKDGDELLLVGDIKQGMALIPISGVDDFVTQLDNAPVLEVDDYE